MFREIILVKSRDLIEYYYCTHTIRTDVKLQIKNQVEPAQLDHVGEMIDSRSVTID